MPSTIDLGAPVRPPSRIRLGPFTGPAIFALAVLAALAFRLFSLADEYAVNIFFWDQWDFNDARLFQHHTVWEIFRWQHGPHRQGLGGLLAALAEPWFRWDSRSEAFLTVSLFALAALGALYLKRRLFGKLSWTDAAIPMILLSTAPWELLWNTVNLAFSLIPLLLILYCLLWTWSDGHMKFALIVLLNFGILYTGFGLFVGCLTPLLMLASYHSDFAKATAGKLCLALCTLASAASLASFFIHYQPETSSGCASIFGNSPLEYLQFVDLMFTSPFGVRGVGMIATGLGVPVLAAVAWTGAAGWRNVLRGSAGNRALYAVPAILSAYSLLFCCATALGRTCLSVASAPHTSRYSSYVELGILGLYFFALAQPPVFRKILPAALLLLLVPSLAVPEVDSQSMQMFSNRKAGWRNCYLEGHSIAECDAEFGRIHPLPEVTRLKEKLDYLRATRQNLFAGSGGRPAAP